MVSHGESFYERASFLMSSLMKHWQDFCLSLCCCAGSDRLWQREKIQWLRERFSKKKKTKKKNCVIYWTINFFILALLLVLNSSHDVKSESITENDICLSDRHIVQLSNAMESFPSLLTLLLCSVVTDLIICSESLTLYDSSPILSFFGPFPLLVGCVTVPLSLSLLV